MKIALLVFTIFTFVSAFGLAQSRSSAPQSTYKAESSTTNIYKTNDVGVGVMIGAPTGVDVKWWGDEYNALHVGVGWLNGAGAVMADWLYHFRGTISNLSFGDVTSSLTPYAGLGLVANLGAGNNFFNHDTGSGGIGARVPLGLEFLPHGTPVGIYAEVTPGVVFTPSTFGFFMADLGGRYYF